MCLNKNCPLKDTCYRYMATPSRRQSYISPPMSGEKCEYYAKVKE